MEASGTHETGIPRSSTRQQRHALCPEQHQQNGTKVNNALYLSPQLLIKHFSPHPLTSCLFLSPSVPTNFLFLSPSPSSSNFHHLIALTPIMSTTFDAYPHSSSWTSMLEKHIQQHLTRVYTSLAAGLAVAACGAFLNVYLISQGIMLFANISYYLVIPALLFFRFSGVGSKQQFFSYYAFAFLDGCATAPLLSLVAEIDPMIPVMAFGICSALFACLSVAAVFSQRRSYLFLYSFLSTGLIALLVGSWIPSLFPKLISFSSYIYFGLFLFMGFVLYDTQIIIEKAHAGDRNYLGHAVELLVDFVAILKRVIVLLAYNETEKRERKQRRERHSATM